MKLTALIANCCKLTLWIVVLMFCSMSCRNGHGSRNLSNCFAEKWQSNAKGFPAPIVDTVNTDAGRFVFYCCSDDSMYVLFSSQYDEALYGFFSSKGGYDVVAVDTSSGTVEFAISSAGYGHADEAIFRLRVIDGRVRCVMAINVNEYGMYSSDPIKVHNYKVMVNGDSIVSEVVEDNDLKLYSATSIRLIETNGLFCTDIVTMDTLYILSKIAPRKKNVNAKIPYVGLHEYEYVYVDNVWFVRPRADEFDSENPFSQMYSVLDCKEPFRVQSNR